MLILVAVVGSTPATLYAHDTSPCAGSDPTTAQVRFSNVWGARLQGSILLLVAPLSRLAPGGTRTNQRDVARTTWDAHDNWRTGNVPSRVQVSATSSCSTAVSSRQPRGVLVVLLYGRPPGRSVRQTTVGLGRRGSPLPKPAVGPWG